LQILSKRFYNSVTKINHRNDYCHVDFRGNVPRYNIKALLTVISPFYDQHSFFAFAWGVFSYLIYSNFNEVYIKNENPQQEVLFLLLTNQD